MSPDIPTEHVFEIVPEGSQETIEAFVASLEDDFDYPAFTHLSQLPEEVANDETPDDDDDEPDDEEVPTNDSPSSSDDDKPDDDFLPDGHILVRGVPVALADIERLHDFDQFLRSNPDAAQRVTQAVQPVVPTPAPAETPSEVTPPDFLDLEDPAQKFMWESHLANQQTLATLNAQTQQREQETINRQAVADMDVALSRFRTAHPNFNDDQITALRLHARDMNIVGAVMATTPDSVSALVRVMDIAAMDDETLRTVYLSPPESTPTPTRQQKSATRKRQLNALGGSSGSAPRTSPTPRPMSDREAIDQFASGLAESFQQN